MNGKGFLVGAGSFVAFVIASSLLGGFGQVLIVGGDDFLNSYFAPIMAGISLVGASIITCTYVLVRKLNDVLKKMDEKK